MTLDLAEPFLTVSDLAALCGVAIETVYWWRKTGRGPKGYRIGRYVRFHPADVEAWLHPLSDEVRGA